MKLMGTQFFLTVVVLIPVISISSMAQTPTGGGKVRELLQEIVGEHPELSGERMRVHSLNRMAGYRDSRYPDPVLSFSSGTAESELRLSQPIPFPGKISADAESARYDAYLARLDLAGKVNGMVGNVLKEFWLLRSLLKEKDYIKEVMTRIDIIDQVIQTRYSTGKGSLADVYLLQLFRSNYRDRELDVNGRIAEKMETIAYYSPDATTEENAALSLDADLENFMDQIREKLEATSPEETSLLVLAARTRVKQSGVRRHIAELEYLPDFSVFAGAKQSTSVNPWTGQKSTNNMASVGLSVEIPVWSLLSNSDQMEATKKSESARQQDMESVIRNVRSRNSSFQKLEVSYLQREELYDQNLIPEANEALQSAISAYETGRIDLSALLSIWSRLYDLKIKAEQIRSQYYTEIINRAVLANCIAPENPLPQPPQTGDQNESQE